jgi:predicted small lipoprotein YifL
MEKILKQLAVILAVALLAGCGETPYKQPSASNNSAQLTITSLDEYGTIDVFGDKGCSPAGAQGRLAQQFLSQPRGKSPARIGAGERLYLRVYGKSHSTYDADNRPVFYKCTYLVSFVPEPGKSYSLMTSAGRKCALDLFEGQTFFPPKSMERHPLSEGCTSHWE